MKGKRRPLKQPVFTHRSGPLFWVGAIVALMVIMLLMRQALNIMGSGGERWQQAELETAINRFTHSVALAHAEWMRQGRTDEVRLEVGDGPDQTSIRIRMSARGWPLPPTAEVMSGEQCMALWQLLLADLDLQLPLTASWQGVDESGWQGECHFYNKEQLKFVYSLHNGRLVYENMQH